MVDSNMVDKSADSNICDKVDDLSSYAELPYSYAADVQSGLFSFVGLV